KHFKIVEDRETSIIDYEGKISEYEQFARNELKLAKGTIDNHKSIIRSFHLHAGSLVNFDSVKSYLDSNDSDDWKSNQLKTLRRYIRDFLKLGNWINEFKFSNRRAKVKKSDIPSDNYLAYFCSVLPYDVQMVFLILLTSGLRVGEVLKLRKNDVNFGTNMVDASTIHKGDTKSAWISYITPQTAQYLEDYVETQLYDPDNPKLFDFSYNTVQEAFKKASIQIGVFIKPHFLRTVFTEKCTQAGIEGKYIDAFCGRIPKKVLEANYTVYSPQSLRVQYEKVEELLTLPFSEDEES
ncbi:MAG: tyrosine-type recombinase/integrase, partial [Nitrosopumilaceae archaeon]